MDYDNASIPQNFIKLIVDDEEAMAKYYMAVFGLKVAQRVAGDNAGTGEAFREVMLSKTGDNRSETFVLFNYVNRPKPRDQQCIIGWVTQDIRGVMARVVENGGLLVGPLRDMPEHGVKVQFCEDPEGGLAEVVELL